MDLKFYKCMHCGNIAIKPFDAGVPLVCCGEKMTELTANTTVADFAIAEGDEALKVYEYCNLHGLWVAEV